MATFALIHGAGADGWHWHLVAPRLEAAGHTVVAPDLPCEDETKGLDDYTDVVVDALKAANGDRPLVVVGMSLGGFTAPLVADRVPTDLLVLVAAMTPRPGESAGEWWGNVGHVSPDPFDEAEVFLHDVPADVVAASAGHLREQSAGPFGAPWPLTAWPDVPTRFLLCTGDRFFPAELQRRVVRERLGIDPDEMDSGHLPALAHPDELATRLLTYQATLP